MDEATPNKQYKVGRVLSKYSLDEFHSELPARWLGENHDAQSLRDLADELNVMVLETAMSDAGLDPLDGEAQNAYCLLTNDDVSAGMRTQQRNQLKHDGIDVDDLTRDFVTHQAVYTYLTDVLGVSKDRDNSTASIEKYDQRINRLRSRTEAVTTDVLDTLTMTGELSLGDNNVVVDIQVYCQDCGSQYAISTLLKRDGCDCAP